MCLFGPLGRVARPPGVGVVLVVALRPRRRARATPGRSASPCRRASPAAPRPRAARGSTDHSSTQLAAERERRVLAGVDRAAGAERPHARPRSRPTRRGGRRASGPRASRTTHSTRQRAGGVTEQHAAPSASPAARASGRRRSTSKARQPRRDAVVRRRAAAAQVGDRAVGLGGLLRRRLVERVAPARGHPVQRPGTAREDSGRVRQLALRVVLAR